MGTMATFLCLLLAVIAANGEYFSHCGRPTLLWHDDAPFLGSLCDGAPKGTQCTELNIGRCYANKGGELAASKDGNYYNTCKDCSLKGESQTTLSCYCLVDPADSTYHYTEIDTGKCLLSLHNRILFTLLTTISIDKDIENKSGFLTCFGGGQKLCRPEEGGQF
ncbi:hypothetical protein DL765_001943 [Monosporascus sp. GIB2]|nr:hypothetical protein DL765_001943 [Monosporascus sp. GIB2]